MNSKFFTFSILNAFRRKNILVIAIIGTGLGTALMATLISLSNGMDAKLNDSMNLVASNITVSADDAPLGGGLLGGGSPLPLSYKLDIEKIDHVEVAQPRISSMIPKEILDMGSPMGSFFTGVDLEIDEQFNGPTAHITDGRNIENANEIIVGESTVTRAKMQGKSIAIGDTIQIPLLARLSGIEGNQVASSENIAAQQPEVITFEVVGFFETGSMMNDSMFFGSIEDVRKISNMNFDRVSSFRVQVDETENVEAVSEEIEDILSNGEVGIQTSISKDLLGDLNSTLDIFEGFILTIAIVSAIAGGMSIFIIMLMSVMERLQEFGIFKATGWSNPNIIVSVLLESITVSLLGSIVGLSVGFIVGQIINSYLNSDIALFDTTLVLMVIIFGVVMGVLGGVLPAVKAARVSPIETLHSL